MVRERCDADRDAGFEDHFVLHEGDAVDRAQDGFCDRVAGVHVVFRQGSEVFVAAEATRDALAAHDVAYQAPGLTDDERTELQRRVRSRKIRAEDARRAQVILMLAAGDSFTTITATVGCYPDYVSRWKQRFEAERVPGLRARYRGQPATARM